MTSHNIIDALPECIRQADTIQFLTGDQIFSQGQSCSNYIIVIKGKIKVFARSDNGKEITLYRIKPGEVCVLTTSCLMANTVYPAAAIVEHDVSAHVLTKQQFNQLLGESPQFREFVFNSFGLRLSDLMERVEQVGLESVNYRLIQHLNQQMNMQRQVKATHQEIANDIGSAREVVSRHLKQLEQQGQIVLRRGIIEIVEPM